MSFQPKSALKYKTNKQTIKQNKSVQNNLGKCPETLSDWLTC